MRKFFMLMSLALGVLASAQATRFIYQVTMKPNSNNKEDVKTEIAYLDIADGKSIFISEKRLQRDSLFQKMRASKSFADPQQMNNLRSSIDYVVQKNILDQKITLRQRIGRDNYSYEEDRTINWNIFPDMVKIGEYEAQKAETEFAGRKWTAWFASDIPLQDGPYKFSGLPGLILKIEDADGDYSFDLKETKKIKELAVVNEPGNVVKVKRSNFEKQLASYQKDPITFMNASNKNGGGFGGPPPSGGVNGGSRASNGGNRPPDQTPAQMKEMEQRIKNEINNNNNPIELPQKK